MPLVFLSPLNFLLEEQGTQWYFNVMVGVIVWFV